MWWYLWVVVWVRPRPSVNQSINQSVNQSKSMPTRQHANTDRHAPVEELELGLAEDDEDRVDELGHLGEDEEHDPQAAGALAVGLGGRRADRLAEGERGDIVQQVGHRADHAAEAGVCGNGVGGLERIIWRL